VSQKERRKTLFQAVRSLISTRSRLMWVFSLVVANAFLCIGEGWAPVERNICTLPLARSEPVLSRLSTREA